MPMPLQRNTDPSTTSKQLKKLMHTTVCATQHKSIHHVREIKKQMHTENNIDQRNNNPPNLKVLLTINGASAMPLPEQH